MLWSEQNVVPQVPLCCIKQNSTTVISTGKQLKNQSTSLKENKKHFNNTYFACCITAEKAGCLLDLHFAIIPIGT